MSNNHKITSSSIVVTQAEEEGPDRGSNKITDPRLLARVRKLIAAEHAGFIRTGYGKIANACIEPGCPCNFDTCGLFRDPPVRCTSFEERVLPLDPEVEAAYWAHLRTGTPVQARRCMWPGCRKQIASVGPHAKYCAYHAELSRKRARREASQKWRVRRTGKVPA